MKIVDKKKWFALLFAIAFYCAGFSGLAQTPVTAPWVKTPELDLQQQAPIPVTSVSASTVGNSGNSTFYYWVVANFTAGQAAPSPAAMAIHAPNALSASNYVAVSWIPSTGALSYDLLRTTTPSLPNTPATIAVATSLTSTSFNDQGGALSSYTLVPVTPGDCPETFPDPTTGVDFPCNGTFEKTLNVNTLNATNINNSGGGVNGLNSGGQVFWTGTGLNYTITAATYNIGGTQYSSAQTNVTLAAADPTNPRIDTFYLDSSGHAGVITGTPAPSPSQPSVDPTTQIAIGFVTVAAGATTPSGATQTVVYEEDAGPPGEWTCTTSGSGWNCADTTHPYAGTKDIQSLGTDATSYVKLTATAAGSLAADNLLGLQLRSESAWGKNWELWVTFYNGATPVGNTVFIQNGNFGFNGAATGNYQLVAIPMTAFNLGANSVDNVQFRWNRGGTRTTNATIYLDNIILENNGSGGGGSGTAGLTQVNAIGDGNFFPTTIPINVSGSVENQYFTPSNAPINSVWSGPSGAPGTGVQVAKITYCTSSTASYTCNITVAAAGDFLVLTGQCPYSGNGCGYSTARSDTLSTPFVHYNGSGSNAYDVGKTVAAGPDVISLTSTYSASTFAIVEVANAGTFVSGNSFVDNNVNTGGGVINYSHAVTASTTTDGIVQILNVNHACADPTTFTASPTGVLAGTWSYASGGLGAVWVYGPSVATSVNYTFTAPSNTCGQWFVPMLLDFTQSAAAGSGPASYKTLNRSFLSGLFPLAIQSVSTFTISSAVNLPSATNTTVLTGAVTMPNTGCPCRVLVQSGVFLNSTTSAQWGWWASDGTNTFGWGASITTDAHTPPVKIADTSPTFYSNGQAVTFSIIINPGTYSSGTVQALATLSPPLPAAAHSYMTLTVMPSNN